MSLNKVLLELLEENRMGYADVERHSGMRYQSIKDALEGADTNSMRLIVSIATLTETSVDDILVRSGKISERIVHKFHPKGNIRLIEKFSQGENGEFLMIFVPGFEGEEGLVMTNINGDNMEGLIAEGDYLIFKEVKGTLTPGRVYLFQTESGIMVKRLKNVTENGLMVTSDNTFFAPTVLRREDVKRIFLVRGFVSKNTSPRIAYA